MHFRIGTRVYSVFRRWNLKLDGQSADGYCAASVRRIYLDGQLDDDAMLATLRHEHTHAWQFEVGNPATPEDHASFAACVGDAFDEEFSAQGGLAALRAIPIEGLRPASAAPSLTMPSDARITDRIECGRCGASIMSGSISTGEPRLLEKAGITVVSRGCQCPVCDAVQVWDEKATSAGLPLGEYFAVRFLTGVEAEDWLREHHVHCPYNLS